MGYDPWHGVKGKYEYKDLTAPVAKPQTYYIPQNTKISPIGIAYAKSHKSVLVYVGGAKEQGFNSKDHAYFANDVIIIARKSLFAAGEIILSQLDLSERAGIDPVATLLLERLLTQAVAPPAKSGKVYACGKKTEKELASMKALLTNDITTSKVAVWQGSAPNAAKQKQIIDFVNNGGNLIVVGQEALKSCSWLPVQPTTKKKLFYRAEYLTQDGGIIGPKLYIRTVEKDSYPYLNEKVSFNPYKLKRW